ncbi:MAG: hypothetical protein ACKVI6_06750, partial [Candidatus Poseidoniales archaeon]
GENNLDLPYYNQSDSLTLYWTQVDSFSGIREVYYGLGSNSDLPDVVNWTEGTLDGFGGINGISLVNESTYYGGAFIRDSAGNYSDTIWGNGIIIDTEFPDTGSISDGQWIYVRFDFFRIYL